MTFALTLPIRDHLHVELSARHQSLPQARFFLYINSINICFGSVKASDRDLLVGFVQVKRGGNFGETFGDTSLQLFSKKPSLLYTCHLLEPFRKASSFFVNYICSGCACC